MNRRQYLERIQDALGNRKLIWVGTRGHDAIGLMDIPQFSEVYGIVAPLGSLSLRVDLALEQLSQKRVDLDTYTIDNDWSPEANEFRRCLLASLTEPACVVAYRSLALLSSICYPRSELVTYLGMFHERQATFEHKPWVESELRDAGVPVIPWRYFADEDRQRLQEELSSDRVLVLRSNRSDGGAGVGVIREGDQLPERLSGNADGFLAAASLLEPHIPLNASACIFRDGTVTVHPSSIQLIGIKQCTRRPFGYCGNDFGAIRELDPKILTELDEMVKRTGRWLHSQGYVGAFGVDALVYEGHVLLTEINPRFQGSSAMCARIDRDAGRVDLYACHVAALLDLPSPAVRSVKEIIIDQPNRAQVVIHNKASSSIRIVERGERDSSLEQEIEPETTIDVLQDGIIGRTVSAGRVTSDGRSLEPSMVSAIDKIMLRISDNGQEPRRDLACKTM